MTDGVPMQYRILAEGYNFHPDGQACEYMEGDKLVTYPEVIHAEVNAIQNYQDLFKGEFEYVSAQPCKIFITHQPCNNCSNTIMAAGFEMKHIEVIGEDKVSNTHNVDDMLKERGGRYGSFEDQATIVQNLKAVMKDTNNWDKLQPDQKECLDMVQHKIARILNGDPDYLDSWDDIIGYVKLVSDRIRADNRKKEQELPL